MEAEQVCTYEAPGRYHPKVEVVQNGNSVAATYSTLAVVPFTLELERGDLAVWGYPALGQADVRHDEERYRGFFGHVASQSGVFEPYFGAPLGTWDGGEEPMGERYSWAHIEVVAEDGMYPMREDTVVLRPTDAMRALVDIEAMAERHEDPWLGYNRPYMANLIHWIHWGMDEVDWIADQPDLFDRWEATTGLDFEAIEPPEAATWSPVVDSIEHTDIAADAFWERDLNCSTRTAWAILWGSYSLQGDVVRQDLLGDWAAVRAIDSVTPGQLAKWLVDNGWAEIVAIASVPAC
jgi:hypothetical protein